MENVQQDTDDDEHVEVCAGGKKGKDAPDVPPPEKVKEHTAGEAMVRCHKRGGGLQRMLRRVLLARGLGPIP